MSNSSLISVCVFSEQVLDHRKDRSSLVQKLFGKDGNLIIFSNFLSRTLFLTQSCYCAVSLIHSVCFFFLLKRLGR